VGSVCYPNPQCVLVVCATLTQMQEVVCATLSGVCWLMVISTFPKCADTDRGTYLIYFENLLGLKVLF
jgi:hypothetical protein